ncbi:MAG: ankyrin repeat domain-containing protein [Flavobacterium sp.]|nr:MAG: ankyrin repeat domain-containing protein [Flavobacterium sp.]
MKKSIVYLGMALLTFTNVALASNGSKTETAAVYGTGVTPLCAAISKGDVGIVKKFIEYGADINERSNDMTPLMMAARYNNVEIIEYLLAKGANINAKNESGFTALKYASLSNAAEAEALLKQKGAKK